MTNLIRREVTKTLLGGSCIETSGRYEAKGNRADTVVQQATRVNDTVFLWICNPDDEITGETVTVDGEPVAEVSGIFWKGPDSSGGDGQTQYTCEAVQAGRPVALPMIPGNSISLFTLQLQGRGETGTKTSKPEDLVPERLEIGDTGIEARPGGPGRHQEWCGHFPEARRRHLHLSIESTGYGKPGDYPSCPIYEVK